jgi:hypothetical protein
MKNPKVDIYKSLFVNRLLVLALLGAFAFACIIFSISLKSLYTKQLDTVLVLDHTGEVIPMKWMQRDENIIIEIKDHLYRFHEFFYSYDAFNVEKNIEKALWYGDKSVEQLYLKRSNDGWFNRVKMYNINQSIEIKPENILIKGNDEPYSFKVGVIVTIQQDKQVVKYYFETSGNIIFVNRNYPLNPHGLLITNFAELNKQEIETK